MPRTFNLIRGVTGIFLAELLLCLSAHGQGFRVAHVSDGFTEFPYAVINRSGLVAFSANLTSPAVGRGIYKGAGGSLTKVIEYRGAAGEVMPILTGTFRMNNAGLVAFYGINRNEFVYVGTSASSLSQFFQIFSTFGGPAFPSINDHNLVQAGNLLFAVHPDGSFNQLIHPCTGCIGILDNSGQLYRFETANNGQVKILKIGTGITQISPFPARDKTIGAISTNQIGLVTSLQSGFAVNDRGVVAYMALEPNGTRAIFLSGQAAPVVEFGSSQTFEYNNIGFNFSLNNHGEVAFYALSHRLNRAGIFKGPNSLTDKIVVNGDIVAGTPVFIADAFGNGPWFNDAGQIVFKGSDANGFGLWVTDKGLTPPPPAPPPASETLEWSPASSSSSSGTFDTAINWTPVSSGSEVRVPSKTSTNSDTALFDLPRQYTVDLGHDHAERLIVRNGNVTFQHGDITVDALSFDDPSMIIDNARLALSFDPFLVPLTPMVACTHALIGQSGAARLDITNNVRMLAHGSVRVGGPGEGILTITAGGELISGESRVGGAGGGHATVAGLSSWETGNLAVGLGGQGDLTIRDGAQVSSFNATIGQDPGSGNLVVLQGIGPQGINPATPSSWNAIGSIRVGAAGSGRLEVRNGAFVQSGRLEVANFLSAPGSVLISGLGTNGTSSKLSTGQLLVGTPGPGRIDVEDGGILIADGADAVIGDGINSHGTIRVNGVNSATGARSTFKVDGPQELFIGGSDGTGTLLVEGGALLQSQHAWIISNDPSAPSEVQIAGPGSQWTGIGDLIVGALDMPGQSFLTLLGGSVDANEIVIEPNGVIRGFGTLTRLNLINRGTISPGLSPGTITIDGTYDQQIGGQLVIEVGGTNSSDYDHLIITSNANLNGQLTLRAINGFAPKTGDHFDFLDAHGAAGGIFSAVAVQNLAPDFQFTFVTNGTLLCLSALNDATFSSALPGQLDLTFTNVGGITYALCAITTTNTCQSIGFDGAFTRSNNIFTQKFQGTTWFTNDCAATTTTVINNLVLGPLAPGDYVFRIVSAGDVLQTISFTVASDLKQTILQPTILSGDAVQFQIDGLDQIPYQIEASSDLINWSPITYGLLPAVFTDFDAPLYPARFYRALIGR